MWSFAEEHFEGELMGDLYQELDPVVKDRFALCQTPDFVRAFILDHTLTPAIEIFGADEVRLLDPACGSGHFLIDGLKRLVTATAVTHPDWDRAKVVEHALDRVVGIDMNDYACALARTRLIMTAAELAGVTKLADASRFHPHIYWADGLEQVERDEQKTSLQFSLFKKVEEKPRATLTRSDVRAALKKVFATKFHAVVANPPYIVESDEARKSYHRELVGGRRRYVTAHADYSLVGPFIERCDALCVEAGFVGVIVSNAFTRKPTGKPLVERVLANVDLQLVVDSSQANIPHHGTPTVILSFRKRVPSVDAVRVVIGKRASFQHQAGEHSYDAWNSLVAAAGSQEFDNPLACLASVSRKEIASHPWTFGPGSSSSVKDLIEKGSARTLGEIGAEIGRTTVCGAEPVYSLTPAEARRLGVADLLVPVVAGHAVRDWCVNPLGTLVYPHKDLGGPPISEDHPATRGHFWRYRSILRTRRHYGRTLEELSRSWVEHIQHQVDRVPLRRALAHTYVATHNHFAYCATPRLYMKTAPALRLTDAASDDDYFALLAFLNSSTACFWLKQVLHPKTHSSQHHHPDPARAVYEFTAAGLSKVPVPEFGTFKERLSALAEIIDGHAHDIAKTTSPSWLSSTFAGARNAATLREHVESRWKRMAASREHMVALQEEADWVIYVLLGMADKDLLAPVERYMELTCPRGDRPFERLVPRESTVRAKRQTLPIAEAEVAPVGSLPEWLEPLWFRRMDAIRNSNQLSLIETPLYKRLWRDTDQNVAEPKFRADKDRADLREWLADRAEAWASERVRPFTVAQVTAALQTDMQVLIVAEVLAGRRDFSLDALLREMILSEAVPNHPSHVYTADGMIVRGAWENVWEIQRREDAGESVARVEPPPEYSQGSRGKPNHFLRNEYWKLRGSMDVPRERFVAFTEVPARTGVEILYGWAGWPPVTRLKVLLGLDEELEDVGIPLADRIGLLDSAWRLLPDVARRILQRQRGLRPSYSPSWDQKARATRSSRVGKSDFHLSPREPVEVNELQQHARKRTATTRRPTSHDHDHHRRL